MATRSHEILVVEDDPDIRESVVGILEAEGYAVRGAEHGAMALQCLRANTRPCLIVLDLMMPVMDGWTFCMEKDKDPSLAEIPVVVVSAAPRSDPKNACLRAVDHLTKPVHLDRLLEVIGQYC